MITGYNTDIEFDGVTYHIQTEDKGLATPVIVSLIYDRGTILASKRVSYDDLLKSGFDERALASRLQKQHKIICAAIKKGRIDDLRKMGPNSGRTKATKTSKAAFVVPEPEIDLFADDNVHEAENEILELSIPKPAGQIPSKITVTRLPSEPVIEAVAISEDVHVVVPLEAVTVVSDLAGKERPGHTKLNVELIGDSDFHGGQERSVVIMVSRGSNCKVIAGAEVMVKVIGSSFRPIVSHSVTDQNGISAVKVKLPKFRSGRATLMVRVMSEGEEVELRRSVTHG